MARLTAIPARHRMLAWDQAKPRPRSRTAEATLRCARSRKALASRHLTGATANDQAGQKTGSVATVYQHKPAGGQAYRSATQPLSRHGLRPSAASSGRTPGAWPRSAPAGGRLWAFRCSGEGRSRSLLSTATPACSGRCIPGGRSCGRVPGDTRLVVSEPIGDLPGAGMRCLSTLRVIGEGTPPGWPFSPSSCRRPGDRVRAGRLHAVADGPPGVGTFGPDPGPAAE